MSSWAKSFVSELAAISLPNVFNPYSEACEEHDLPNAPQLRRLNLEQVLDGHIRAGASTFWLGRDFGYRGARRTGISLTDEGHLEDAANVFGTAPLRRATRTTSVSERTATVTWGQLKRIPIAPLLWNAFPLHPHEQGSPMTNRAHSASERRVTCWALEALLKKFRPVHLVAIGNSASEALGDLGIGHVKVRHPSYGGQSEFISGIEAVYDLKPKQVAQLELI